MQQTPSHFAAGEKRSNICRIFCSFYLLYGHKMSITMYSAVLFIAVLPSTTPNANSQDKDKCFCQLSGKLDDCCCVVEDVDHLNKNVFPRIMEIVKRNYFKFYKVNLDRPCPFWSDNWECSLRDCSVKTCNEEDIPDGLKGQKYQPKEQPESCDVANTTIDDVDLRLSDDEKLAFETWRQYDDAENSFCEPDDESSTDVKYVNLLLNPERFTNYKGESANRVWYSIYKENCFKVSNPYTEKYEVSSMLNHMCLEKRVFYRVISGMHASINTHLAAQYLFKAGNGIMKPEWGPNVEEFHKRFDPDLTRGQGPIWLKNLYFLYLLVWRAVVKAGPYWLKEGFYTGQTEEDSESKVAVMDLLAQSRNCPTTFDETQMFTDRVKSKGLKEEFRKKFRNITKIMDCVGCEKCRLWGKVQTQGIGTALKILFSSHQFDKDSVSSSFRLNRNEVVSLFNALGRYSSSIHYVQTFRSLSKGHR